MTDFIPVSREHFYAVIGPLEGFSFRSERMEGFAMLNGHRVIGRYTPGYLCRDEQGRYTETKKYFLTREYAEKIKSLPSDSGAKVIP